MSTDWLASFVAAQLAEHPGLKLDAARSNAGHIVVSGIVVPRERRGRGIGEAVMRQFIALADEHGDTLALTPSPDFGGSVTRLRRWCGRLGFRANKGRGVDFEIGEDMVRRPIDIPR